MPNSLLMIVYDDLGNRYELPPFILNEPLSYGTGEELPDLNTGEMSKKLSLTLRSVAFKDSLVETSYGNTI